MDKIELLIQHGNKMIQPVVIDGITWTTERSGCPGEINFETHLDNESLKITEGDAVRLKVNDSNIFYGFIFKLKRDKKQIIKVTAYDQLRYLKNKDTYVYENKTASELVKLLAADFKLQTGSIADTKYKIPSRVEDNETLFDMIQNALDLTLQNKNTVYILYDDFGKLTLKSLADMKVNLVINEESGENYSYSSSIDDETYNQIKLIYENDKTGKREVYIAKDSSNINSWGVLQHFDKLQKDENGQAKADALLSLYNKKTRNLTISEALGDTRVRAGSLVGVMLDLGDIKVQNYMLVEKCKHEFMAGNHLMNLTLRGGDFNA